ncbi:cytochrome P450 [Streptomonospora nanhaiensis]|uniref:Cytochrome P450 n=1 Tax=Streptomonospora nanhaiensis TaxID=1323731 RepID=A0A853BS37_9ACTN|nr:cytochrome P450 [Streptomonospora nanhaiensis]MBV2366992.1 cytochrome P450 [Streptomonospora nanhaiensis]MBX9390151.1 cytochrome P450 [Streptomonospora nanhaiensis]NYI97162.1 cytochrome P450 [Streptomonospora nanhaiensis]
MTHTSLQPAQAMLGLLDPENDDPYPLYAALRESGDGVQWCEPMQAWFATRHEHILEMCRNPRVYSSEHFWAGPVSEHNPADPRQVASIDVASRQFMVTDPPDHTRLRRILSPHFNNTALNGRWRDLVERVVADRLDRLRPGQTIDFMDEVANLVPVAVIAGVLGAPFETDEDLAQWRSWSRDMGATLDISIHGEAQEKAVLGQGELIDALAEILHLRRDDPRDDLISAVAHLADDDGEPVDERDVLAQLMLLFAAGNDTTIGLLGNGVELLLKHPETTARVVAEGAVDAAVEEILRFEPPVHFDLRLTTEPVVLGETEIDAGQQVFQILPAANRDPRVFADPDTYDPWRPNARSHLSFLHGPHHCIGSGLARLEGRIMFTRLLERFPGIRLAGDPVRFTRNKATRGLALLPVTL